MNSAALNKTAYGVIAGFLLLMVFLGLQIGKFRIDASADTLLTEGNRHYLVAQQASLRYGSDEFILVAFKPHEGSIFANSNLSVLEDLSADIQQIPRVAAVRSLINVPLFTGLNSLEDDFEPDDLTWERQRYPADEFEKKLTNHPLYEDLLFNKAKTALSIQVVFAADGPLQQLEQQIVAIESHLLERDLNDIEQIQLDSLREQRSLLQEQLNSTRAQEIDALRAHINNYQQAGTFYLGGGNLLAHQLIQIIRSDLLLFGSVIALIVCVILYLLFRRIRWVVLPMLCCGVSVLMTLGLLGGLGLRVTVISANVIALQIILTLAVVIHLVVQYQELAEHYADKEPGARVLEMLKRKLKPSFYAGLTTGIGFGSLIASGVQPVISFGWMMVLAILVTFFVGLVLFPALLLAFFSRPVSVAKNRPVERAINGSVGLVRSHPAVLVITACLVLGAGVAGILRLTAENSFLDYFDSGTDVYRELSFIDQEFGGSTPFDLLYTVPPEQRKGSLILTAEAVETIGAIQTGLSKKEGIGNITSVYDFTTIAATVANRPLTEYELTAFYRVLDKALRQDLFGSYFNEAAHQVRISARIQDTTEGLNRAQLLQSIHDDMAALGIAPEHYTLTNLFVLYEDILSSLVRSQFTTLGIVYLAMILVLLVVFRSFTLALISLVPNVITTASIFGVMGLAGIPLDLMTITIAAVAMGISMDNTIHYVHRYQEELQSDPQQAVARAHLSVGYAMIYTTVIIAVGFSALMFSDFVPSVMFGLLTAFAMVVALLSNMSILPVLLQRFVGRRAANGAEAAKL